MLLLRKYCHVSHKHEFKIRQNKIKQGYPTESSSNVPKNRPNQFFLNCPKVALKKYDNCSQTAIKYFFL